MKVEVRQAAQRDSARCFAITEDAMRKYVEATWGEWDATVQRSAHAASFSPATHWLVFADGKLAGLVAASLEPTHIQLLKLYLLSDARDQGIGARLLESLLRAAALRSQPLRLRVLAVNTRAQAFYSRHGLREVFRTAERVFMEATPATRVRDVLPGEVEAVRQFLAANGWSHRVGSSAQFAELIRNSQRTAVAFDGSQVVGFARGITDGQSNGYLSMVAVSPEHRRNGLGRALVSHVTAGPASVTWALHAEREGAAEFFTRLGFSSAPLAMRRARQQSGT